MTQRNFHSDITILGAGPAGLTAAINLAKNGIPCLLIDGSKTPGEKICGDGLSGKVLSTLSRIDPAYCNELNFLPSATPSYSVRFYSPKQHMAEIGFQSGNPAIPPGYVCKRRDLDQFLLKMALSYPSVQYLPKTIIDQVSSGEKFLILSSKETGFNIQTKLLLLATGSDRRIIQSLIPGYPAISQEGIGIRVYFENLKGFDRRNAIEIHFLKELLPWYFWIFPFGDNSANVGLALPMPLAKKSPMSLKELLMKIIDQYPYLKERFEEAKMIGKPGAHRLPYYTGKQQISGDNFILLGDAAHLVDPFTGEGISNAMQSGQIAAEMALQWLDSGDFSHHVTLGYEQKVYEKLGPELELSKRLQELARQPKLLNLVIGKASKNQRVRKLVEEMLYNMNTKGKLNQPMFYLKLMLGI